MASRRTTRRTTNSLSPAPGEESCDSCPSISNNGKQTSRHSSNNDGDHRQSFDNKPSPSREPLSPGTESDDLLSEQFTRQVSLQQQEAQQDSSERPAPPPPVQEKTKYSQKDPKHCNEPILEPPSLVLTPLVAMPPPASRPPESHKRELPCTSGRGLVTVGEGDLMGGLDLDRMSSVNSVEMLTEGGARAGNTRERGEGEILSRPSAPCSKRSNGNDTPMGIRALKHEGGPGIVKGLVRPPDPALCCFGGAAFAPPPPPSHPVRGMSAAMAVRTLIIYPLACLEHETLNHQESKDRLLVLCGPQGVLRRPRFASLEWADGASVLPATTSDILRVHEYDYIRHLRAICQALPPVPHHSKPGYGEVGGATIEEGEGEEVASSLLASLPPEFQPEHSPTPPVDLVPAPPVPSSPAFPSSGASSPAEKDEDERETGGGGLAYNSSSSHRRANNATPSTCAPILKHHTSIRDFPAEKREVVGEEREKGEGSPEGGGDLGVDAGGHPSGRRLRRADRGGEAFEKKERAGTPSGHGGQETVSQFLDSDTRVCHDSFRVACVAAGAVIQAVDQVAAGRRRVFVATRPPGHHAGPRGAVPSHCFWKAPSMTSSGFCLLNNVAIGAAYARQAYGRAPHGPFARVAIVDFDIHHGNGTEDIVRALQPSRRLLPLPASWAPEHYQLFKPWLSEEEDAASVFFGSINLVDGPHFYPCSGREMDNDQAAPNIVNVELRPLRPPQAAPGTGKAKMLGPRKVKEYCQRASVEFREKVSSMLLPKLKAFAPDLLFISAG